MPQKEQKIAAAVYLYQADNDGEWGEIRFDFATGTAEILGCTDEEVAPFVHLSILAINNYMIFAERALFDPQIEAVKKELSRLAERKGRNNR